MSKAVVEAGICGFTATVEVTKLSARKVKVVIVNEYEYEMLSEMGSQLEGQDWQDGLKSVGNSPIHNSVLQHIRHAAYPVPVAILKILTCRLGWHCLKMYIFGLRLQATGNLYTL